MKYKRVIYYGEQQLCNRNKGAFYPEY